MAKRQLRALTRQIRQLVPPEQRHLRDACIQENLLEFLRYLSPRSGRAGVQTIAAYSPLPGEPGGADLPAAVAAVGADVVLPRVTAAGLEWASYSAGTQPGAYGIAEPVAPAIPDLSTVDVIIIPALAVDSTGRRLGQGGGFYDRAMSDFPASIPRVALVDDCEFLADIPSEPHDLMVSTVITPSAISTV